MSRTKSLLSFACVCAIGLGCNGSSEDKDDDHGHEDPEPFELAFVSTVDGTVADCTTPISGLGPEGAHTIGLSDLRFYISNVEFHDADAAPVAVTFDEDDFQYTGETGWVALVDLTGNVTGSCEASAISFSEGTARTHEAITGTTLVGQVASVSFDVGVPQALMQEVIGANTVEGAPSPLNEMYWSWNSGYRHFVFNLTVSDGVDDGEGYVHLGSTGCTNAEGELALETRDNCEFVNTPSVSIPDFDLAADTIGVDLGAALGGLDFLAPVYDPETFEIIGEQPGVECHSFLSGQPDCTPLFEHFGLDPASGAADPAANSVFGKQ